MHKQRTEKHTSDIVSIWVFTDRSSHMANTLMNYERTLGTLCRELEIKHTRPAWRRVRCDAIESAVVGGRMVRWEANTGLR